MSSSAPAPSPTPLAVLRLLRWPGAVTAAADAATGFLLAGGGSRGDALETAVGVCGGGALVYSGGVVLNDFTDAERDRDLHPERPIPRGTVAPRRAATFAVALFVGGFALSTMLAGPWAGLATGAAAVAAVSYDVGPRHLAIVGAFLLALARAANGAAGMLAATGSPERTFGPLAFPLSLFAYALLLTYGSTLEESRSTRASAVTIAAALWIAVAVWVAAAVAVPLVPPYVAHLALRTWHDHPPVEPNPLGGAAAALPLALHLVTLALAAREAARPGGPGLGAVVRCGVFGYLLLDATWLLGAGRMAEGAAVVAAWIVVRLGLRRSRS